MTIIKKTRARADEDVGKLKPLYTVGRNIKWCSHLENSLAIPEKVRSRLSYDPAILLLSRCLRKFKTRVHIKTHT